MKIDSLLNYIGHKSKVIEQIVPHLPQSVSGTFYDCFAGSCVVGLNVPYDKIVCVEKNTYLSELYRDLSYPDFTELLKFTIEQYGFTNSSIKPRSEYLKDPNIGTVTWMGETIPNLHLDQLNKEPYKKMMEHFNAGRFNEVSPLRSIAYMILTLYGRNSSVNTNADGTLSGSVGPLDFSKRAAEKLQEHIQVLSENRHTFVNKSYQDIQPTPDDFVYLDPPYLASSYRYGGWSDQDERDLLAWIDQLPCDWALSNTLQSGNRKNEILMEWAKGKRIVGLNKKYRKWAGVGRETNTRDVKVNYEVLILNK